VKHAINFILILSRYQVLESNITDEITFLMRVEKKISRFGKNRHFEENIDTWDVSNSPSRCLRAPNANIKLTGSSKISINLLYLAKKQFPCETRTVFRLREALNLHFLSSRMHLIAYIVE